MLALYSRVMASPLRTWIGGLAVWRGLETGAIAPVRVAGPPCEAPPRPEGLLPATVRRVVACLADGRAARRGLWAAPDEVRC